MKAAIVTELGKPPIFADFAEPAAADGEALIDVTAAPLSHVTRYRASGTHYSSAGSLPFVVGLDGVGRHDGKRVYFILPRAPFGSMAERTVVQASHLVPLPDGLDDATAAAIAIPAMSSWAALQERSKIAPGQVVLVNGATGFSGRLAVQVAKRLGAGKIIATGRNSAMLAELSALGADNTISRSRTTPRSMPHSPGISATVSTSCWIIFGVRAPSACSQRRRRRARTPSRSASSRSAPRAAQIFRCRRPSFALPGSN
jgi:NADPH:quinone reductase-like Zn-dependent oxidoreductase